MTPAAARRARAADGLPHPPLVLVSIPTVSPAIWEDQAGRTDPYRGVAALL